MKFELKSELESINNRDVEAAHERLNYDDCEYTRNLKY